MKTTTPLTLGEFAEFAASHKGEEYEKFNSMLALVEGIVAEKCAKIAEAALDPTEGARIALEIRKAVHDENCDILDPIIRTKPCNCGRR